VGRKGDNGRKLQIPSSKLQRSSNIEAPKACCCCALGHRQVVVFEVWDFFGIWSLVLGVFFIPLPAGRLLSRTSRSRVRCRCERWGGLRAEFSGRQRSILRKRVREFLSRGR